MINRIKNVVLFVLVFVASWLIAVGLTVLIGRIAGMPWYQINIGIGISFAVFVICKGKDFVQTIKDELNDED